MPSASTYSSRTCRRSRRFRTAFGPARGVATALHASKTTVPHRLIGDLTVYENVELPLTYRGLRPAERRQRVDEALEKVEMAYRARHLPSQLSGGQQQRVAVARAVAGQLSTLARRRADRQPRLEERRGGDAASRGPARRRVDDLHGHPRSSLRPARRPRGTLVRRAGGGRPPARRKLRWVGRRLPSSTPPRPRRVQADQNQGQSVSPPPGPRAAIRAAVRPREHAPRRGGFGSGSTRPGRPTVDEPVAPLGRLTVGWGLPCRPGCRSNNRGRRSL